MGPPPPRARRTPRVERRSESLSDGLRALLQAGGGNAGNGLYATAGETIVSAESAERAARELMRQMCEEAERERSAAP